MFSFFNNLRRRGSLISIVVLLEAICLWYLFSICTDAYWSSSLSYWTVIFNILTLIFIAIALVALVETQEKEVDYSCFSLSCVAFICLVIAFSSELGEMSYYNDHKTQIETDRQAQLEIKKEREKIEADQKRIEEEHRRQTMAADHDCYNFADALVSIRTSDRMVALLRMSANPCSHAQTDQVPATKQACYNFADALVSINSSDRMVALLKASINPCYGASTQ